MWKFIFYIITIVKEEKNIFWEKSNNLTSNWKISKKFSNKIKISKYNIPCNIYTAGLTVWLFANTLCALINRTPCIQIALKNYAGVCCARACERCTCGSVRAGRRTRARRNWVSGSTSPNSLALTYNVRLVSCWCAPAAGETLSLAVRASLLRFAHQAVQQRRTHESCNGVAAGVRAITWRTVLAATHCASQHNRSFSRKTKHTHFFLVSFVIASDNNNNNPVENCLHLCGQRNHAVDY